MQIKYFFAFKNPGASYGPVLLMVWKIYSTTTVTHHKEFSIFSSFKENCWIELIMYTNHF
jgi:hypothetical protein